MISANKEQKLYITEIQKKIMDAFLVVANESNSGTRITMNEIANKVRMTPQAIYRKHFKSVIEISDTIRDETTDDIIKAMDEAFVKDKNLPILEAIAREVIPVMYKYRFALLFGFFIIIRNMVIGLVILEMGSSNVQGLF